MLTKCHISGIVISGALIIFAVVVLIGGYHKKFINSELNSQLAIDLNSPAFDDWVHPPPPIYMQYWVFNCTNPEDFANGKKANLTQVGPFTYRLYQPKYNVAFFSNDTVTYQYNHTLVFERDMSVDDPNNVTITNVNVPMLLAVNMITNLHIPEWMKELILAAVRETNLFPKHTAYELLFGYNDRLLGIAHKFFPNKFPAEFGLFYGFNNTDDGVYLVNTGKSDILLTNSMEKWNYVDHLDYWSDKYGNMLNGTDGVFFHPNMSKDEQVYAYSTDICRSLPFSFEIESKVRGIGAYRYHTTEEAFANTTVNPDNAAFCVPPGNCMGSGVLNISVCKQNAPVVISSPHFYLGDEKYIHGVIGMNPSKDEHETYIDVEPNTGIVLSAQKRLQLNIQVEPSPYAADLHNVNITTFPFVWLNESVYVDKGSANHLKEVLALKRFVLVSPYVLLAIGVLILLLVGALVYRKRRGESDTPLLTNVDDDEDMRDAS